MSINTKHLFTSLALASALILPSWSDNISSLKRKDGGTKLTSNQSGKSLYRPKAQRKKTVGINQQAALQCVANDESHDNPNSTVSPTRDKALPGPVEAVEELLKLQGAPAHFVALPFSMTAKDNSQGYAYNFLGQSGESRLAYAGDNYLVTMERIFGSFDKNAVALHFWDAHTFAYKSSILHNGMLGQLTPIVIDEEKQRFAIAFWAQASAYTTQGALAYNLNTGELEYTDQFNGFQYLENSMNGGSYKATFRSPGFADLPPFKHEADNIFLSNIRQLKQIPQFTGLACHFTATDESTIRSIDFDTLRTLSRHPESATTGEIKPEDIPKLPAGMKVERIAEQDPNWAPHYRLCKPEQETRTLWALGMSMCMEEEVPPLFIYDIPRQKLYPLPQSALALAGNAASILPVFGDSDCDKVLHNTMMLKRWTEWSGPELLNKQTGKYEKIIFNGKKSNADDTVAYNIEANIPDSAAASIGSQLSVWNAIPGDDQHTYWLAASEGYCALFLMDETAKTGKLVQSWKGVWGNNRWTPARPMPVWLPDKKRLCLPMKDHCWEVYELADPTTPTEKKFTIYTGTDSAWVIVLPDGRYAGTPGCETLLYADDGENGHHGVQAWVPWRNRPAEVLEAIGGNTDDIAALRATTKRWLARKGMNVDNMPQEPAINDFPRAKAEKTPLMPSSDMLEFDVTLTAAAKKALTTLEVRADGAIIPQEWSNSLLIAPGQQQTVRVKIPLRAGQNNIELTPIDSMALAGEPIRFRAVRPRSAEGRLFIVSLGVADYDDDTLDLQFAAKDAKDLSAAFAEHGLGEVKSLTLTDKEVADSSVLERVRTFLAESKAEDRVVMYLAGHGMLDEQLEYHYAPASFNVDNIQQTGISMDKLSNLLQSIPARERLLLLDTCHSGQLGEAGEEKLAASGVQLPHGVRAIQTRGMKVKKATGAFTNASQQKRYIEEMFNLSQEFRGINIVAGAAGAEFALESGEWNNGVFTAAIIRTLKNVIDADQNADGLLSVDEMLSTLQKQVTEMTGGAQKPNIVAAENSGMALAADTCYEVMQSDWDAICTRIQKAGSSQEALFILDLIKFYQGGCIYADERWEDTDYSKDTYLSQCGRNYDATQCEHLKKAFLLGQKNPDNIKETVPADVWKAAILRGVSPDIIRKDFRWNDSDDSHKLLDFMIEKGYNPNTQNSEGNTLLHSIARNSATILPKKHLDTLYVLLRHGANSTICNHKGEAAVNEQCEQYMLVQAVEKLVRYTRENTQSPLADGFAPATLNEKIVVLDYTRAEASLYDVENDTRTKFKKVDASQFGPLKKAIQPGVIKEDSIAYVRAYTQTGPHTAKLSKFYVSEPGFYLAQLVADHADDLSAEQIADILSVYLTDGGSQEIELTFTSPATATGTEVSMLDSFTEQTLRHVDVSLSDTLPPMETETDTTDTEQRETQEEATEDRSSLDPLIARMAALRCKHADSALYQKRLLTLLPMIRNGADVDLTLPETKGNTALHYSCAIGSLSITRWLLEHGANANAMTDAGKTPLQCVGSDNRAAIIQALKAHGAQ